MATAIQDYRGTANRNYHFVNVTEIPVKKTGKTGTSRHSWLMNALPQTGQALVIDKATLGGDAKNAAQTLRHFVKTNCPGYLVAERMEQVFIYRSA